jgi:hypothetical protein
MNYTIKTKLGINDFSIGTQLFTQTEIPLTECKCLVSDNFNEFFKKVEDGDLEILKKGVLVVNQVKIISKLITKFNYDVDDALLNEDYLETKRFLRGKITDPALQSIDEPYIQREQDGRVFYAKERASLLLSLSLGNITKQDLRDIEKQIKDAKNNLYSGDYISAKDNIIDSVVGGGYTQTYKDYFLAELQVYIESSYPSSYW